MIRIVPRLRQLYPDISGTRLKRAVEEGQVSVNGAVVDDPGTLVTEDAPALWDPNRKVLRRVVSQLTVLHEDADSIAVVKPAGLLTHPTEAKEKDTLQSRVSGYVARREKGRSYLAVVHRLDKETSGVLVFARSRRALVTLQAQLRAHTMDRAYVAVVEGNVEGESGTFDTDLVEDRGDRRRGVARPGQKGLKAVTRWKVLERFGIATLVEARLETGRTHQIRVHFAAAGHPLVGDPVYRDPKRPEFPVSFARQALHAGRLGWQGPDGQKHTVEAPPPPDLEKLIETLRKKAARHPAGSLRPQRPQAQTASPVPPVKPARRPEPVAPRSPRPATTPAAPRGAAGTSAPPRRPPIRGRR